MKALDRITWRDGQLLTSRDLRDGERNYEVLRRLHIRYLHRTWGVVDGLNVTATSSTAFVTPGYALDNEGRELLLPHNTSFAAPANIIPATTIYLVISHAEAQPNHCGCLESPQIDLETLCPGARAPGAFIEATLAWKTVTEVRYGIDVLLARVLVTAGQFASAIDTSVQHHATSLAQPRIWSDITQSGQTGWTAVSNSPFGAIQAVVDTSDAGFSQIPTYFARVVPSSGLATTFISFTSPTSFTLVLQPVPSSQTLRNTAELAVAWLGIEMSPESNKGRSI